MADALERRKESRPEAVSERAWVPPRVDIYENRDEVLLVADLPGVEDKNLKINLDKDQLTLEAHTKPLPEAAPLRTEFTVVDYKRAFTLPAGIDGEKVSADLKQGVLRLHLPKSAALKPRRIEVKAG